MKMNIMKKKKLFLIPLLVSFIAIGVSAQNSSSKNTSAKQSHKMSKQLDYTDNQDKEKLRKKTSPEKPSISLENSKDVNTINTENKKQSISPENSQAFDLSQKNISGEFTPNVTVDLKEPTIDYTIIDYKPRTNEAISSESSVREGTASSSKIKPIEDYSAHELLAVYQKARPATKEKILANKILKAKLISAGVDLNN